MQIHHRSWLNKETYFQKSVVMPKSFWFKFFLSFLINFNKNILKTQYIFNNSAFICKPTSKVLFQIKKKIMFAYSIINSTKLSTTTLTRPEAKSWTFISCKAINDLGFKSILIFLVSQSKNYFDLYWSLNHLLL